ncbi:YqeG family HAD IIIA-type phosphatase [Lactobacillus sp. DCY120]|uniref:YqeG family HAD IIIA-type phosphatase n=1 Tax=Bombilactobacillus apium TaxID=2675299 RepID=A0A850R1C2_9LACO|nr:YqeG family HAD IIIA-type phosphatase [Bombilactobacillus apium]NVY96899.1 YqeG family HAD IIIA-type phosphatase [Bombilactobacillus apium]
MFKPTMMIDQILDIDPQEFLDRGITVILSDLDNTLVPWNERQRRDQKLLNWTQALVDKQIQLVVASNNSQERVEKAVAGLHVTVLARAHKPLPFVIQKFLRQQQWSSKEVVFVGDQVLTDVLAGNLAHLQTILVRPLVATDAKKTRINRFFERPLMWWNQKFDSQLRWRQHLDDK